MNEVEKYIAKFPDEIRERLVKIRQTVKAVMPHAEEKISYQIPTFKGKRNLFHYAAYKNHIGIYPGASGIEAFADEIENAGFKYSKGTFQIDHKQELPLELIQKIAIWCRDNLDQ